MVVPERATDAPTSHPAGLEGGLSPTSLGPGSSVRSYMPPVESVSPQSGPAISSDAISMAQRSFRWFAIWDSGINAAQ